MPETATRTPARTSPRKGGGEASARYRARHGDELRAYKREYAKAWRKANPERAHAANVRNHEAHREKRNQYNRVYYAANVDRLREKARAYQRHNFEEIRPKRLARYWSHPELARLKVRNYIRTTFAQRRDHLRKIGRETYRRDPMPAKYNAKQRRARKKGAEGRYTRADILALETAQAGLCAYCQQPYGKYHIDHKQPLSRGGSNWSGNLCLTCPTCNMSKNSKTEAEFRALLLAERP